MTTRTPITPVHQRALVDEMYACLDAVRSADDDADRTRKMDHAETVVNDLRLALAPGAIVEHLSAASREWLYNNRPDLKAIDARRRYELFDSQGKVVDAVDTPEQIGRFVMNCLRAGERYTVRTVPVLYRSNNNHLPLIDDIDRVAQSLARLARTCETAEGDEPELSEMLPDGYPFDQDLDEVVARTFAWQRNMLGEQ